MASHAADSEPVVTTGAIRRVEEAHAQLSVVAKSLNELLDSFRSLDADACGAATTTEAYREEFFPRDFGLALLVLTEDIKSCDPQGVLRSLITEANLPVDKRYNGNDTIANHAAYLFRFYAHLDIRNRLQMSYSSIVSTSLQLVEIATKERNRAQVFSAVIKDKLMGLGNVKVNIDKILQFAAEQHALHKASVKKEEAAVQQ